MSEPAKTELLERPLSGVMRQFAHDLKGHLGTTGLYFFLLDSARTEEERAHALESLRESFAALDRAATDLADAGRQLGQGAEAPRERVDLSAVVATNLALAARAGHPREVTIDAAALPSAPWPTVLGDPEALSHTLARLFCGAVGQTANGQAVRIRVTADERFLSILVPWGESPRVLHGLREHLARVADGSRESGLALALVQEILRQHGGELERMKDGRLEARLPVAPAASTTQTPR